VVGIVLSEVDLKTLSALIVQVAEGIRLLQSPLTTADKSAPTQSKAALWRLNTDDLQPA